MKIDFVDLQKQNRIYAEHYKSIFMSIVKSASFISGPALTRFEHNFAKFCGKKFCIGVNSGTDALLLSLKAYGIGFGDEVITAANSYFSTAMIITLSGAKAVFADINPQTYNIDPEEIKKHITKRTKAIIPVHIYGQAADMNPIIKIAAKFKLKIIEDCCQAHGCLYNQKRVPVSETGAFSFYPGKNLGGFGDGGAIVTNNSLIADKIRYLHNDGSIKKYTHKLIGYKSRLDTIQAAILDFKLTKLNIWNHKRHQLAQIYSNLLKDIPDVKIPFQSPDSFHVFHLYVIETKNRNQLHSYLQKKGISTVIHYPKPIHLQKPYLLLGYKSGDFPISEENSKKIISLPMYPELTKKQINYVVDTIKEFYK